MKAEEIKNQVKKSYGEIAIGKTQTGCCGDTLCCETVTMQESYENIEGYQKEADLALGCGIPTEIANIKLGDTVIDLGSGAGNDVFVARSIVGDTGKVIGVDITPEMIVRAIENNKKLGYQNVGFILGDIEEMTDVPDSIADVVVSNCVMNLVPNKEKAFSEIHRVLKEGGHFSISDIVYVGQLPENILEVAEMYAGCVSGASEKSAYLGIIKASGFKNIQVKKERKIVLPDELLLAYLSEAELQAFKLSGSGIYSVTIYADKLEQGVCCDASDNACCGVESNQKETSCCQTETNNTNFCCN